MHLRRSLLFCIFLSLAVCSGRAQGYLYATGTPENTTSLPIDQGIVNVNNGEIHLEIPIATKTQRGAFAVNEKLIYDSRIWKIVQNGSSYSWQPTNVPSSQGGWTFSSGAGLGNITYRSYPGTDPHPPACPSNTGIQQNYNQYINWNWTDPTGTTHAFPGVSTTKYQPAGSPHCTGTSPGVPSSSGYTNDGSGYFMSVTNYTNAIVTDLQGKKYTPQTTGSNVTDTNGNYWSTDANGNLVDTSGLTPVLVSSSGNSTYYDVLGVNGNRQRYTVTTAVVSFNTSFNQSAVTEANGSFNAIQSITLPDGSAYSFTYNSGTSSGNNGEMNSMTLPTGGVVTFNYTNFIDSFNNTNAWVSSIVRDGATTSFTPAIVSSCSGSNGCQERVTIGRPDGNDTVYTFSLDPAAPVGSSWLQNVDYYQGHASGGTRLRSTATSYTYNTYSTSIDENGTYRFYFSYVVPTSLTSTTTLPDINYKSQTTTTFWPRTSLPGEVQMWDFYNAGGSSPATPTTDTVYTYARCGLPSSVIAKDGSGTQVSETTYGYDETAPTATSGVPQHVAVSNTCNLTSKHQWINTSGTTLDQTMTYDDTGFMLTSTDPNGTTQYGYDATHTFVTSTTLPTPSSGASLTNSATYDANSGVILTQTEPNGTKTVYSGYDALSRPTEIDVQDSGSNLLAKTTYAYNFNQLGVQQYQTSSVYEDTETLYDAYGRTIRTAAYNGQNSKIWYQQDTCYDSSGRAVFQAIPYQGDGWSTPIVCSGGAGATTTYDALGRPTSVANADGTAQYSYAGRAIQKTDVSGVQTITQMDAFGRIASVCELSSQSVVGDSPVACGMDIAGTGYLTSYAYDLANHKTIVTQGSQTRTFQTDGLGRTTYTSEPERGATTFSYAYNSTGLLITRVKPSANVAASSNTSTTTSSQYDSLGRLLNVTYTDGTPAKLFQYDRSQPIPGNGFPFANGLGRLTAAQTGSGTPNSTMTEFAYDAMGHANTTLQCFPGGCGNPGLDVWRYYNYNWGGQRTQESFLQQGCCGARIDTNYTYSPAGEITGISNTRGGSANDYGAVLSNVQNTVNGPSTFTFGNGLNGVRVYDGLGRNWGNFVCSGSTTLSCNGGTQLYGTEYAYQGTRVTNMNDTILNTDGAFGYDDFNRLTSASFPLRGQGFNYTYDRYGNRWTQNLTQGSGPQPQPQLNFNLSTNQMLRNAYDGAGNVLTDGSHQYSYDAEGNVTQVDGGNIASYSYDALNHRVRTDAGGTGLWFAYNTDGARVGTWSTVGYTGLLEAVTYWNGQPLATFRGGQVSFEHQDLTGTERLRTGPDSSAQAYFSSLPFGDGFAPSGTDADPHHFAKLDHDSETDTQHAMFRQYSSAQGRWMSPDPYDGSYNLGNPQSLNRYAYVGNNPLSFTDPSGLFMLPPPPIDPISIVLDSIIAAVDIGEFFSGFFAHPQFNGSTTPRPSVRQCIANCGKSTPSDSVTNGPGFVYGDPTPCLINNIAAVNSVSHLGVNLSNVTYTQVFNGGLDVDFSVAGASASALHTGRYALSFMDNIFGLSPALHVPAAGGDDPSVYGMYNGSFRFTTHIDSYYSTWHTPLGAAAHAMVDVRDKGSHRSLCGG